MPDVASELNKQDHLARWACTPFQKSGIAGKGGQGGGDRAEQPFRGTVGRILRGPYSNPENNRPSNRFVRPDLSHFS